MKVFFVLFCLISTQLFAQKKSEEIVLYVTDIKYEEDIDSSYYDWYLLHGIDLNTGRVINLIINYCSDSLFSNQSVPENYTNIELFDVIRFNAVNTTIQVPVKGGNLRMGRAGAWGIGLKGGGSFLLTSIDSKPRLELYWIEKHCPNKLIPQDWLIWRSKTDTSIKESNDFKLNIFTSTPASVKNKRKR